MGTHLGPLKALLAATAGSFLFDLGVSLARGWTPTPDYVALCAALALGAALLIGLLTAPTRRPEIALALWMGLNIQTATMLYVTPSVTRSVSFAVLTWLCLRWDDRRRESPWSIGLSTGVALCFCAVILPRLFSVLSVPRPIDTAYVVTAGAALALALLAQTAYGKLQRRIGRIPNQATMAALSLLAMVLAVPAALTGPATQETVDTQRPPPRSAPQAPDEPAPVILLIVLDTVRADHLSLYGYTRDTSPALENFVADHERAVVYPFAFSTSNWTLPAHASLFTGLMPSDHGAHSGHLLDLRHALSPDFELQAETTLAEVMQERGFHTAALLANAQVMFFNGTNRGFDQVVRPGAQGWLSLTGETLRRTFLPGLYAHVLKPYPDAQRITDEILAFLDVCGPEPCFILANYMEAHWPFAAAPPYQGYFNKDGWPGDQTARYDEELLALDAEIGSLLRKLEDRGILDRAWIAITADHGEEFWEHGSYMHGSSVYNTQVRVPLIFHPPAGESVEAHTGAVSLLDVTATLSAAAGAPPLGDGRDLRQPVSAAPVGIQWYGRPSAPPDTRETGRAVVMGQNKLIERNGRRELYELARDPHEERNAARSRRADVKQMRADLPPLRVMPLGLASGKEELSVDEVERLKALGYAD